MADPAFHDRPFDPGTLTKLKIFELYTQEWLPVFLAKPIPPFPEVHIFDFFCGPGTDSVGQHGSPLRVLSVLRGYQESGRLAGWGKATIIAHFFDADAEKIERLREAIQGLGGGVPGVQIDVRATPFARALKEYDRVLRDPSAAKLLIIDQFGVDEVSAAVFDQLLSFPRTDFIFFLSSSTLHRFRDHPAIKQKIERPEDSYHVHRAAFAYYRGRLSKNAAYFLAPFSIKKGSNIYGLIFGSQHPLGIYKFLRVAWKNDEIAGEANFDIERENIAPEEGVLAFEEMRPKKIVAFERELETAIREGEMGDEADLCRFCLEAGMTPQHATSVLSRLKKQKIVECGFRVPDIDRMDKPRPVRLQRSGQVMREV